MNTMREAAETAETAQFDPAIAAASGAAADALQNGKIANKVLKLTGEVQVLNIKIAKAKASGDDTSDLETSLAAEQYVFLCPRPCFLRIDPWDFAGRSSPRTSPPIRPTLARRRRASHKRVCAQLVRGLVATAVVFFCLLDTRCTEQHFVPLAHSFCNSIGYGETYVNGV